MTEEEIRELKLALLDTAQHIKAIAEERDAFKRGILYADVRNKITEAMQIVKNRTEANAEPIINKFYAAENRGLRDKMGIAVTALQSIRKNGSDDSIVANNALTEIYNDNGDDDEETN